MTSSTIDWDYWFDLPQVRVWQAVALSLDLDPDRLDQSRDYWRHPPKTEEVPGLRERDEFVHRLRLLVNQRLDAGHFTPGTHSVDTPANHRLRLAEVASWLVSMELSPIAAPLLAGGKVVQHGAAPTVPGATPTTHGAVPTAHGAVPTARIPGGARRPPSAHETQHAWQEEQIRRTTRALGFDPLALPHDDRRKDFFVKSIVRSRCGKNHPVELRAALFDRAWERMMTATPQRLRYAEL